MDFIRKAHAKAAATVHAKAQHSPAVSWLALSLGFIALALMGPPN